MARRVFVGNLPFSATEDELRELFVRHGEVSSVEVVKDRFTGRSRGFAFVEMATDDGAAAAVAALNQHQLGGRPLTINLARPRSDSPGGLSPGRRDDRGGDARWQAGVNSVSPGPRVEQTPAVIAQYRDGFPA